MKKVHRDFNPPIYRPLYFIRKGILKGVAKHAPSLTGKLMDFGCGMKPYKPLCINATGYTGVDYEGGGHSHENEQIDVYYDGKTLPFENNTFDSIITSEVFEHIFNLEDILKELNRVLKPGGKILITTPFVWDEHEIPNDFGRYTSFGMKALLERNGFNVVEINKSTNFIETIFQLWPLYWSINIFPKLRPFGGITSAVFCFFNNCSGWLISRIFPKGKSLYLNLIVLAEKR